MALKIDKWIDQRLTDKKQSLVVDGEISNCKSVIWPIKVECHTVSILTMLYHTIFEDARMVYITKKHYILLMLLILFSTLKWFL